MTDTIAYAYRYDSDTLYKRGLFVSQLGKFFLYASLATIFFWVGGMKFTAYEANGILPFLSNSPLTKWMYSLFSVQTVSYIFGVIEISIGALIALRLVSPAISIVGGLLAVVTYVVTLTFLLTTPGVGAQEAGGFPALSAQFGQFLAKDTVLLAASFFVLGESLLAAGRSSNGR